MGGILSGKRRDTRTHAGTRTWITIAARAHRPSLSGHATAWLPTNSSPAMNSALQSRARSAIVLLPRGRLDGGGTPSAQVKVSHRRLGRVSPRVSSEIEETSACWLRGSQKAACWLRGSQKGLASPRVSCLLAQGQSKRPCLAASQLRNWRNLRLPCLALLAFDF
jgi:hypothetical protein